MEINAFSPNIAELTGFGGEENNGRSPVRITDDGLGGSGSYLVYQGQLFGSGDLKGLNLEVTAQEVTPEQIAWLRGQGWAVEVVQAATP